MTRHRPTAPRRKLDPNGTEARERRDKSSSDPDSPKESEIDAEEQEEDEEDEEEEQEEDEEDEEEEQEEDEEDPKDVAEYIADHHDYHAKLGEQFPDSELEELNRRLDKMSHSSLKEAAKHLSMDATGSAQDLRDRLSWYMKAAEVSSDPVHVLYRSNVNAHAEEAEKIAHEGGDPTDFLNRLKLMGGTDPRFAELVAVRLGAHRKTDGKESASKSVKAIMALMEKAHKE